MSENLNDNRDMSWVYDRHVDEMLVRNNAKAIWHSVANALAVNVEDFETYYADTSSVTASCAAGPEAAMIAVIPKANADVVNLHVNFRPALAAIEASSAPGSNPKVFRIVAEDGEARIKSPAGETVTPKDVSRILLEPLLFPSKK